MYLRIARALSPLFVAALLMGVTPVFARTITLTEGDADKMAVITAEAPRLSWASMPDEGGGVYNNLPIQIAPQHSFLIHFPLDKIPKGCRITKAEWSVPIDVSWGNGTRLFIWRLLVGLGRGGLSPVPNDQAQARRVVRCRRGRRLDRPRLGHHHRYAQGYRRRFSSQRHPRRRVLVHRRRTQQRVVVDGRGCGRLHPSW